MMLNQGVGSREHEGLYEILNKLLAQGKELVSVVLGKRLAGKPQVGMNIQLATFVLLVKGIIFEAMGIRVNQSFADQKLPPGVIAVTANQGFIQVKYRQRQNLVSSLNRRLEV